jgi:hypothetical protein
MSTAPDDILDEQDTPPEYEAETIELATKYGWKSPDDWKGDPPPDGFIAPDDYLARPKIQLQVTQDKFDSYRETQEAALAETREINERMKTMYEESTRRQREAHQAEVDRIKAERQQAYEDHDVDKLRDLDRQQEQLKPVETESQPAEPPEMAAFKASNPWYDTDLYAKGLAMDVANKVYAAGGDFKAQVAAINREMPRLAPHLFEGQKKPATVSKVDGGGLAQLGANPKGFDSLPKDARDQAERDVADGLYKSKEDWAKMYYGDS